MCEIVVFFHLRWVLLLLSSSRRELPTSCKCNTTVLDVTNWHEIIVRVYVKLKSVFDASNVVQRIRDHVVPFDRKNSNELLHQFLDEVPDVVRVLSIFSRISSQTKLVMFCNCWINYENVQFCDALDNFFQESCDTSVLYWKILVVIIENKNVISFGMNDFDELFRKWFIKLNFSCDFDVQKSLIRHVASCDWSTYVELIILIFWQWSLWSCQDSFA